MAKLKKKASKLGIALRDSFIKGILTLIPIGATIWVLSIILKFGDKITGWLIEYVVGFRIPPLSFILDILLVVGVGVLADNILGKKVGKLVIKLFERLPIIKEIYKPIRDIFNQLTQKNTNNFKKVVYTEFPRAGSHSIGFITNDNIVINGEEKVAIFIPTTPNPTSGFLIYLSTSEYKELDIPVDVALKSIISLGAITPEVMEVRK